MHCIEQPMVGVEGVTPDVVNSGQAAFYRMSWMGGRELRVIFSADLTTLCRDSQSEALRAPDQTLMQLVSIRSIVAKISMVLILRHSPESTHWECALALQKAYSHHWPGIITTDNRTGSASFYSPALHLLHRREIVKEENSTEKKMKLLLNIEYKLKWS